MTCSILTTQLSFRSCPKFCSRISDLYWSGTPYLDTIMSLSYLFVKLRYLVRCTHRNIRRAQTNGTMNPTGEPRLSESSLGFWSQGGYKQMFLILFHLIIKIVYLLTYLPNTRYVHVIYMCHLYWLNYATEYVVCIALLASILQPIFHVHMCLFRCKK